MKSGYWLEPPNGTGKMYPYESSWWKSPIPGWDNLNRDMVMKVGEVVTVRFIIITILPLASPVSFYVKSASSKMDAVIEELKNRQLPADPNKYWFTQVGRNIKIETDYGKKEIHGVATVIGNSSNTCFISIYGECGPKHSTGSVTISNIVDVLKNPTITIPAFGDPKLEVYTKMAFLKAAEAAKEPPVELNRLEEAFTNEVFVYFRGVRLGDKTLCPSLYSSRYIHSESGSVLMPKDHEKSAENFVLVFDSRSVVPKFKIPRDDGVRVFHRVGVEVTFQDGRFSRETPSRKNHQQTSPGLEHRWVASERSSKLTTAVSQYLRRK